MLGNYISERKISAKFVNESCYYAYLNRESSFTPYVDTDKLGVLDEVSGILLICLFFQFNIIFLLLHKIFFS